VNAVSPGAILWPETPIEDVEKEKIISTIPMGKRGHPTDIARTVRFFIKEAPYVTGQVLAVDGGRTLSL
jgi:pteridine reductase